MASDSPAASQTDRFACVGFWWSLGQTALCVHCGSWSPDGKTIEPDDPERDCYECDGCGKNFVDVEPLLF